MCGIIHTKLNKGRARKKILKLYNHQRSRGTQGFGYIAIKNGKVATWKQAETEKEIMKFLKKEDASEILFHHRYPTSTPNFEEATHPIFVSNKELKFDYYLVHNGVITNASDLYEEHIADGYEYTTEMQEFYTTAKGRKYYYEPKYNDSESLAIDFAQYIEGLKDKLSVEGRVAFICYQVDKKTKEVEKIYYGRNFDSPLELQETSNGFSISSENPSNNTQIVRTHTLFTYDYKTQKTSEQPLDIAKKVYDFHNYKYTGVKTTTSTTKNIGVCNTKEDIERGAIEQYVKYNSIDTILLDYPELNSNDELLECLIDIDATKEQLRLATDENYKLDLRADIYSLNEEAKEIIVNALI